LTTSETIESVNLSRY